MTFYHNIDPIFLSLGPIEIRYYGLIFALGFILTYLFLKKYKKATKIFKSPQHLEDLLLYLIIGTLIGARLFMILFYNPSYYFSNPLKMLAVWEGGLSFHGGITGAAIAIYIFSKKRGYNFLSLADLLCIPATLALAFGRIANFINGELYGRPTNLPWGVKFKGAEEFRHPSQLYESLKNFLILLILYTKDKKSHKPGHIFSLFLILYSVLRFSVEFVRVPELYVGPLTMGQTLSIPLFIIGIILYKKTKN